MVARAQETNAEDINQLREHVFMDDLELAARRDQIAGEIVTSTCST